MTKGNGLLGSTARARMALLHGIAAVAASVGGGQPFGLPERKSGGTHRTPSDTKAGRRLISPSWFGRHGSLRFVALRNSGGGERECARRRRQLARGQLVFQAKLLGT